MFKELQQQGILFLRQERIFGVPAQIIIVK